ncbi:muscle M-line assembly protein unc-89-like [Trematomus bernacchii]|uniref:muscle M-line assembly protein unc-89-like n=1 Tax=Trematomus bernacchii TaxID=40690 RepID=UPI001469ADF2|nr:muscle M-line assembly protein unc-89-like [Trematomus bernacchii]XP_034000046.1 muscle M-line assembly protein unc-89-like [Trematomus bernacchii]
MGVLHSTQSKEGEKCQHVTEVVQADGNSSEEETSTATTQQRDLWSIEGDSTVHMSDNSATKIGAGMPEGSNKLKICVTDDVNIMKLVSGIASDGTTQSPRERGCPKLTKHEEHEESGDVHADISVQTQVSQEQASNEDSLTSPTDQSLKKRGRPRNSETADVKDSPKGDSEIPTTGRPKGSTKHKLECLTSEENERPTRGSELSSEEDEEEEEEEDDDDDDDDGSLYSPIRKKGRPRKVVTPVGSTQNTSNETPETAKRGRPRKSIVQESGDEQEPPVKKAMGRPKGSTKHKLECLTSEENERPTLGSTQNKKKAMGRPKGSFKKKVLDDEGQPESSPPQKVPAKKGRPRKYPLPTLEELNAPKVQKKLGRPRKSLPASSSSPSRDVDTPKKRGPPPGTPKSDVGTPKKRDRPPGNLKSDVGTPKKRGRPPGTPKSEVGTPHKRGRPRGSVRQSDAKLKTTLTEHSEGSDASSDGEESVE